jgi:hypothetical protein
MDSKWRCTSVSAGTSENKNNPSETVKEPTRGKLLLYFASFLFLIWLFDSGTLAIVLPERVCKYPGHPLIPGVYQRVSLSDAVFTRQNGQKYYAAYTIQNITPDIMGMMVRIARLKYSEGEHPSDGGDDHGNPQSDEDQVEYRWYINPGLDPLFVFQGYGSSDGQYAINGYITLGQDIPVVFDSLQTDKEYRVNLIVWTNWDSDPAIGFSRVALQEIRFRHDKFHGNSISHLTVSKSASWVDGAERADFLIQTRWQGVPEGQPPGYKVLSRNAQNSPVEITPDPVTSTSFDTDLYTYFIQNAAEGAPVGIQTSDGTSILDPIGGGSIIKDTCGSNCPSIAIPTNFAASTPYNNVIRLSWGAASNANAYDVYRAESQCPNTTFIYRGMTSQSPFNDTVRAQYTYYYKIRGKNGTCAGDFTTCVAGSATGNPCDALPSPAPAQPTNGATGVCATPTFSWASVPHASTGYLIEVFTNGTCTAPASYSATLPSPSLTWILPGTLPANTLCSWHIQALGDDIYYCHSDFSPCRSFTTSASGLTTPVPQKPGWDAINQFLSPFFKWDPVTGASTYLFELFTGYCGQTSVTQQSLSAPEWKCTLTLNTYTVYYWMVTAKDANGCSGPQSRCCSFLTGPAACQ